MLTNRFSKSCRSGLGVVAALIVFVAVAQSLTAQSAGLLNKSELRALIAKAETPADHMKLAGHFTAKAEQLEAEAKEHRELAKEYKQHSTMHGTKHPMSGQIAEHCEYFADELSKAAKEARAVAAAHEKMAKEAKK